MIPQVKKTYGMSLINAAWNNLKPALLRTLVESMPGRRVKAILKSKGGHTKY
jgi:hypothetical protein